MEVYLVGEQLRQCLHNENGLVTQRQHQSIVYSSCFVGIDVVEWLLKTRQVDSRHSAVKLIRILEDHHVVHHVCDQIRFLDDCNFYRFRKDDATFANFNDLRVFFKGLKLYNKLHTEPNRVLKLRQEDGLSYDYSFTGRGLLDWILSEHLALTRQQALKDCRELLVNNVIHHVAHEKHFKDEELLYQFSVNFKKPVKYSDILGRYAVRGGFSLQDMESGDKPAAETTTSKIRKISQMSLGGLLFSSSDDDHSPDRKTDRRISSIVSPDRSVDVTRKISAISLSNFPYMPYHGDKSRCMSFDESGDYNRNGSYDSDDNETIDSGEDADDVEHQRSSLSNKPDRVAVLPHSVVRQVSAKELENPNSPYVKKSLRVVSDSVGYGFVVRGSGPTFVQTVDPKGPAYEAGLRIRQYLCEVNGENVLRQPHQVVAKRIINSPMGIVNLTIMVYCKNKTVVNVIS